MVMYNLCFVMSKLTLAFTYFAFPPPLFPEIQINFVLEVFCILCEDGKPDESEPVDLCRRRKCSCSESAT